MRNQVTHIVVCKHATIRKKTKYLTACHQFSQYSGTTPITGISVMQIIIIQNFITAINGRQEKTEKFHLNCERQKIPLLPIAYQTTHCFFFFFSKVLIQALRNFREGLDIIQGPIDYILSDLDHWRSEGQNRLLRTLSFKIVIEGRDENQTWLG